MFFVVRSDDSFNSVCRLRERGRLSKSKSVYVRAVHDSELLRLCSSLCGRTTALISRGDEWSILLLLLPSPCRFVYKDS